MRPRDLALLRTPSAPTLSPDGASVCYAVTRLDLEADAYRSDLWLAPTDAARPPRKLTFGPRDTLPRFSPDGRWIAFLRAGDQTPPQLHVLPADGGEPRRVSTHALGVSAPLGSSAPAWAPDSRRIAYVARVPEPGRYGTDDRVTPEREPPRRITTRRYRLDQVGWTIDRRPHVFVIDALDENAEPQQLTSGDYDHGEPAWHPGGAELAFVSSRHDERDLDLASDLFVIPVDGGEPRQVTSSDMVVENPAYTPDGARIVFTSRGVPLDAVGRTSGLWSVRADGSARPKRHTDEEAHDLRHGQPAGPVPLVCDGEDVLTVRLARGAVQLVRVDLDSGAITTVIGGHRQVTSFDAGGGLVAATVAGQTSTGEVVIVDGDGGERALTGFGGALARATTLRPLSEITAQADDGYPVHGWVVKPAGEGPFPVLLNIHGGPHQQYGWALFDEAQVYAGAGYAVVLGNPRGSSGYGQAHGRAVIGAVGDRDEADLLAVLDAALADPDLDGGRVGVMGGSYGGLMTTLLAGRHDRFAAAISERALNAFDSFAGTSDIGSTFPDIVAGPDPERQAAQSPLTYADGITCPMLVIHSEEDWRCPLEQGQRLYARLKRNGVAAEMLVFPGEGHELSRSGLPSHRVARFEAILEWWRRHLPAGA